MYVYSEPSWFFLFVFLGGSNRYVAIEWLFNFPVCQFFFLFAALIFFRPFMWTQKWKLNRMMLPFKQASFSFRDSDTMVTSAKLLKIKQTLQCRLVLVSLLMSSSAKKYVKMPKNCISLFNILDIKLLIPIFKCV